MDILFATQNIVNALVVLSALALCIISYRIVRILNNHSPLWLKYLPVVFFYGFVIRLIQLGYTLGLLSKSWNNLTVSAFCLFWFGLVAFLSGLYKILKRFSPPH